MGVFEQPVWFTGEGGAGLVFEMDAGRLVTNVASAVIRMRDPDGTRYSNTAVAQSSARYWGFTTTTSTFPTGKDGNWRAQPIWTHNDGTVTKGLVFEFPVGVGIAAP